jgi:hypothetical protein
MILQIAAMVGMPLAFVDPWFLLVEQGVDGEMGRHLRIEDAADELSEWVSDQCKALAADLAMDVRQAFFDLKIEAWRRREGLVSFRRPSPAIEAAAREVLSYAEPVAWTSQQQSVGAHGFAQKVRGER